MALRTIAETMETMTGAIHFVPWPKPSRVEQFCIFHVLGFPPAEAEMPELCIPELHQPRTASTTIARNATKSKSPRLQVFQEPHLGGVHGSILF
jgi:hypothetical protein